VDTLCALRESLTHIHAHMGTLEDKGTVVDIVEDTSRKKNITVNVSSYIHIYD
jgi:hypothetical protein